MSRSSLPPQIKCLLDGIKIDHANKVIQPYDLKTIGRPIYTFATAFYNLGYYLQGAVYYTALKRWLEGNGTMDLEGSEELRKKLQSYKLHPLVFIVTEKKVNHSNPATIFRTYQDHVDFGMYGGENNGKTYKGVWVLIHNYQWHKDNQYWDLNYDLYHNKGEVNLNLPTKINLSEVQSNE